MWFRPARLPHGRCQRCAPSPRAAAATRRVRGGDADAGDAGDAGGGVGRCLAEGTATQPGTVFMEKPLETMCFYPQTKYTQIWRLKMARMSIPAHGATTLGNISMRMVGGWAPLHWECPWLFPETKSDWLFPCYLSRRQVTKQPSLRNIATWQRT